MNSRQFIAPYFSHFRPSQSTDSESTWRYFLFLICMGGWRAKLLLNFTISWHGMRIINSVILQQTTGTLPWTLKSLRLCGARVYGIVNVSVLVINLAVFWLLGSCFVLRMRHGAFSVTISEDSIFNGVKNVIQWQRFLLELLTIQTVFSGWMWVTLGFWGFELSNI